MFARPRVLKAKVEVSPKFQIVIPRVIREEMKIEPGEELFIYVYQGKLHVDTHRPITELRGDSQGNEMERRLR
jgi:AbrB family looped-hinge helix DNA binding protein